MKSNNYILALILGCAATTTSGFASPSLPSFIDWTAATDDELTTNTNWFTNTTPTQVDTAAFGRPTSTPPSSTSNYYNPVLGAITTLQVDEFAFFGDNSFTITIGPNPASILDFFNSAETANGVTNNSTVNQNFVVHGTMRFRNFSSADSTESGKVFINPDGNSASLTFSEFATASNANINAINGAAIGFSSSSSAGNSIINLNASLLNFSGGATAAASKITAEQSSTINYNGSEQFSTAVIDLKTSSSLAIGSGVNWEISKLDGDSSTALTLNGSSARALTINNTEDCTFAGAFIVPNPNAKSLIKKGPAKFTLSGSNTDQKNIIITEGTLILDNIIMNNSIRTGLVGVRDAGTLAGTATIWGSVLIKAGGTISPGNSIGQILISDFYEQDPFTTYVVEINKAGQSDLISVFNSAFIGSASLFGGDVVVSDIDGRQLFHDYTILSAVNGVSGTFDSVTDTNPLVIDTLRYDGFNVFLSSRQNLGAAAQTQNEINVANALDSITAPTSDQLIVLNALVGETLSDARDALNDISGEQYTYFTQLQRYGNERFNRRIYNALRPTLSPCWCMDPCASIATWFQVEEGQSYARKNRNCDGLRAQNWDFSLGAFTPLCNEVIVGVAANYQIDHVKFYQGGHTNWHTGQAAIYGAYQNECGYIMADFIYGRSWGRLHRSIEFADIHRTAKSTPKTSQGLIYTEIGVNFCLCDMLFQPFIAGEFGFYNMHKIRECGSDSLDLNIGKKSVNTQDLYVGSHLMSYWDCFTISADIAWQYRFGSSAVNTTNAFQDQGSEFEIEGVRLGNNAVKGALNISSDICNGVSVYGQLSGERWQNWSAYGIDLGITLVW